MPNVRPAGAQSSVRRLVVDPSVLEYDPADPWICLMLYFLIDGILAWSVGTVAGGCPDMFPPRVLKKKRKEKLNSLIDPYKLRCGRKSFKNFEDQSFQNEMFLENFFTSSCLQKVSKINKVQNLPENYKFSMII